MSNSEIKYGDWVAHNGGECPVDPAATVQVQTRGQNRVEAENRTSNLALAYDWEMPTTYLSSITDYREVIEPVRETQTHSMRVSKIGSFRLRLATCTTTLQTGRAENAPPKP